MFLKRPARPGRTGEPAQAAAGGDSECMNSRSRSGAGSSAHPPQASRLPCARPATAVRRRGGEAVPERPRIWDAGGCGGRRLFQVGPRGRRPRPAGEGRKNAEAAAAMGLEPWQQRGLPSRCGRRRGGAVPAAPAPHKPKAVRVRCGVNGRGVAQLGCERAVQKQGAKRGAGCAWGTAHAC